MNIHSVYREISENTGVEFKSDEPLAEYSLYRVGGKASAVFFPKDAESGRVLAEELSKRNLPYLFLGNGSNVLISDDGYGGAIISTKRLKGITINGNVLTAMAGDKLADALTSALYNSLGGMEFLCGIPASVGGAVAMNAGCFGKSVSDYVLYVVAASGVYKKSECDFDYRSSRFLKNNDGILSVCFGLENVEYDQSENKTEYFTALRKNRQPKGRSCGSVFKNDGYFAGKIIENNNLKGFSIGGAKVSEKHANFILAEDGATAKDVYRLIQHIKTTVRDNSGIELKEELRYIGNFDDENKL